MEGIQGMDVFEDVFVPVYHTSFTMKENNDIAHYNNESSAEAESLFELINVLNFFSPW